MILPTIARAMAERERRFAPSWGDQVAAAVFPLIYLALAAWLIPPALRLWGFVQ